MQKIKLDLDALTVESFDTRESGAAENGTVLANEENTGYSDCDCASSPYYSQCCTGDEGDTQCYDSYNFCVPTQRQICPPTGDELC